jgi:hypothetical protein
MTPSGKKELLALKMIHPSTGWFEVKDVKDKSAKESIIFLMTYDYSDTQYLHI